MPAGPNPHLFTLFVPLIPPPNHLPTYIRAAALDSGDSPFSTGSRIPRLDPRQPSPFRSRFHLLRLFTPTISLPSGVTSIPTISIYKLSRYQSSGSGSSGVLVISLISSLVRSSVRQPDSSSCPLVPPRYLIIQPSIHDLESEPSQPLSLVQLHVHPCHHMHLLL